MKPKRSQVRRQVRKMPRLQFGDQSLTSFSGLVLFAEFFMKIGLQKRLAGCLGHLDGGQIFSRAVLFLQLIVHVLLGYRDLRDERWYRDDPLVKRVLGLNGLPDVSTIGRMLKRADATSVTKLRGLLGDMVPERLHYWLVTRVTLDFDGSVLSTKRHAEGTAVGYNTKRKGARSYYPLFCTVAQTGQVFDFLFRSGNVHDSKDAAAFILACISRVRAVLPGVPIEVRMDSAFFNEEIVSLLDRQDVEFTISVPFERFTELKRLIDGRVRWRRLGRDSWYFETDWKPQCWSDKFRFVFIRSRVKQINKKPIQLDLFVPTEYGYEFKVIVTNKTLTASMVARFHEGRGAQEGVFAELKSQGAMSYIPVRGLYGNQVYLSAGLFAYNLAREFQMTVRPACRGTTPNRATTAFHKLYDYVLTGEIPLVGAKGPKGTSVVVAELAKRSTTLWVFEKLDTLRRTIVHRAGRFTRPGGILTLTISAGQTIRARFQQLLAALHPAA